MTGQNSALTEYFGMYPTHLH